MFAFKQGDFQCNIAQLLIPTEAINLILKIPVDMLKNLDLTGCDIHSESISEITNTIKNYQRLQVMKLSNNDFTTESADELVKLSVSLKDLKKLMLSDVAHQSDAVYKKFCKLMQSSHVPKSLNKVVIGKGLHILRSLNCKDLQEITISSKSLNMMSCTIECVNCLDKILQNRNTVCALSVFNVNGPAKIGHVG